MRDLRCPILVGRTRELDALTTAVERAGTGAGGVVFLAGEAGMGKSRLAAETADLARSSGLVVLSGRAVPGPTPVPFRPLVEAFGAAWRGREPPATSAHDGLRPAMEVLVPAWSSAHLGHRADTSTMTVGEAALALLDGLGGAGALLVLDDLQWSDPESLAVIEYLADQVAARPVLVVIAVRTGERSAGERLAATLTARRRAQALPVTPLDAAGVRSAVAATLGADDPPPVLLTAVGERSDGSPFLIEELLAVLTSVGALACGDRGWEVRGALPMIVPDAFATVVAERLAALPTSARGVVELAAVLGERFDWRLVAAAWPDGAVDALRLAVHARIVEESHDGFRFRHALTRTAVLGQLLAPDRARLARRALNAMPDLDTATDPGRLALAAQLAETAGDGDRSFALQMAAARSALRVGAVASARDAAVDARRLADTPQRVLDARRAQLDASMAAGDAARIGLLGARLVDQLVSLGAPAEDVAEVHHLVAAAAVAGSDLPGAVAALDAAARCVPTTPPPVTARHQLLRAEVALAEHRTEEAFGHARAARTAAARAGRRDLEADALTMLGRARRSADLGEAERWFSAAVGVAELSGSALCHAIALHELATIDVIRIGRTDRVLDARRMSAQIGAPGRVAATDLQLAVLHWKRFELDDARAAARRAADAGHRFGLGLLSPLAQVVDGCVDAVLGHRDSAVAAFETARPSMDAEIEASGRGNLLAVAALAVEDRPGALDELARATALAPPDSASARSPYRGLHALLLAVDGSADAPTVIDQLAAIGAVDVVATHSAALARAVLAGRAGDGVGAAALFVDADTGLIAAPWMRSLGRRLVAEAAISDGWGDPAAWLHHAHTFFAGATPELARACRSLLRHSGSALPRDGSAAVPPELAARGITRREADVLALLARGRSNREIADRLVVSPRTVEKHVERLLSKTGTTRRTQLVAMMTRLGAPANPDGQ
ncbi:MAG: LuxR family transcriptional regulator [Pseudonocardiaceae bacterium]|nr:MAG: LuxR family transcriptional regulator [Pseudonocardiaceae bacterium]